MTLLHHSLLLGAALCAALSGCSTSTRTDESSPLAAHQQAIRNGQRLPRVVPLSSGQQLAVGWIFERETPSSSFCTGTLIAPRVVVTARHCTTGLVGGQLGFGFGILPETPDALIDVTEIVAHPDADVALLVLADDAVARLPGLAPIAFNRTPMADTLVGREVEAAGFGETLDPERDGRFFALVELFRIEPGTFWVDGRQREGLCFGDSGGPALTVDALGQVVVLGVEHGGEESCIGKDQLTRLDVISAFIDEVIARFETLVPCGGVGYEGRCEGDVAVWCHEDGSLARLDCAAEGRACGYVDDETGFYCKALGSCGGPASRARCEGNVRIGCEDGQNFVEDCGITDGDCMEDAGGAVCIGGSGGPRPDGKADAPELLTGRAEGGQAEDPIDPNALVNPLDDLEASPRKSVAYQGGCSQSPLAGGAELSPLALLFLLGVRRRR